MKRSLLWVIYGGVCAIAAVWLSLSNYGGALGWVVYSVVAAVAAVALSQYRSSSA
jgi:hypothetical protein